MLATVADYDNALVSLTAEVARTYAEMRTFEESFHSLRPSFMRDSSCDACMFPKYLLGLEADSHVRTLSSPGATRNGSLMAKARNEPKSKSSTDPVIISNSQRLKRKEYEQELARLHVELVQLQEWVRREKKKVCIVFEGRDGAGKGGVIKALTERVSPRTFRSWRCPPPPNEKNLKCICRGMCLICRPPQKSLSSTAAGITARASRV
jgi:Polyphosphate kinase 2 (PPK2)